MTSSRKSTLRLGSLFLLASAWSSLIAALDIDICASFNTASMAKNVSIYQTNGLCHDFCIQKAAFAITQGNGCWCSDYFPDKGSTVSTSQCNFPCPAYPAEDCGGDGLFGYIQLNQVAPSGTKTASSSSATPARITTVTASVTKTVQDTASLSTETSATSRSSSSAPSGVQTTTDAGGDVRTVTITPSQTSGSGDNGGVAVSSPALSPGAIAGIVIGVLAIVAIAIAAVLIFWLRRRKQNEADFQDDPSVRGSSSGMIGSVRPEMSVNGGTPASPASNANRNSTIQIDPRMDPFKQGLYVRSGSHESLNTLRDDHDYSRRIQPPKVLRAMNPDPVEG